jgi:hypothetical protein
LAPVLAFARLATVSKIGSRSRCRPHGAALAGRDAADHLRAVGERLLVWNVPVLPVMPWDDLRVLVDQDGHQALSLHRGDDLLGRVVERFVGRNDVEAALAMIFLPSSTFVPSRRTTSGT